MTSAAARRPPVVSHAEPVMGTVVSFSVVPGGLPDPEASRAIAAACAGLHHADAVFSTWDPGSPVSRLRRGVLAIDEVPPEVAEVLQLCRAARAASGGWFDPWAATGGVDPTGLVKGWAVERALAVLRDAGVTAAMVNGGGDIAVFGPPPVDDDHEPTGSGDIGWRIGIRHPWRADALAAIVTGVRAAIATSGRYERSQHLFSPQNRPLAAVASATITGPSLAMADALATALAVGGDHVLGLVAELHGYEGYLIRADGTEADTGGIAFG
jgi:thiamine biosynthesis lipoprotein